MLGVQVPERFSLPSGQVLEQLSCARADAGRAGLARVTASLARLVGIVAISAGSALGGRTLPKQGGEHQGDPTQRAPGGPTPACRHTI